MSNSMGSASVVYIPKYQLIVVLVLTTAILSGCPIATLPTKEEPANVGASSQPQSETSTGAGQSRESNDGPSNASSSEVSVSQNSSHTSSTNSTSGGNTSESTQVGHDQPLDTDSDVDINNEADSQNQVLADSEPDLTDETSRSGSRGVIEQEPDLTDSEPQISGASSHDRDVDYSSSEHSQTPQQTQIENSNSNGSVSESHNVLPAGSVITAGEKIAILDRELAHSSGRFDQMILRERENIRSHARNKGGTTVMSDNEEFESLDDSISSSEQGVPDSDDSISSDSVVRANNGERSTQVATYAPPLDIPDGNDDDVVARQLREAAMVEPDPKLREKLWEEYRRYKGVSQ